MEFPNNAYDVKFWYDTLVVVKLLHWEFHIIWSYTVGLLCLAITEWLKIEQVMSVKL